MFRETMKPYVVKDSGARVSTIMRIIHDLSLRPHALKANPMDDYRKLLQALIDRFPGRNYLAKEAVKYNAVKGFVIQHDVDINIVSAIRMAEVEQEMGVKSTYYILHNALYYCFWGRDQAYRHNAMASVYRYIQDLGHEIGIHIDPLDILQGRNMDGLQAMKTELKWLRDNGLDVVSMASHNSWKAYGANNWEVFQGRNEREEVQGFKLGTVDEKALGLECDAYDVLRKLSDVTFIVPVWDSGYRVTDDYYRDKKRSDLHGVLVPQIDFNKTKQEIDKSEICLVSAHPVYYQSEIKPEVTVVNVLSLTKSGTTLLLMLLASDSENKAFALGHANNLYLDKPIRCKNHRPSCPFWDYFLWAYDPNENLFCQIARQSKCTHIITDNLLFDPNSGMTADLQDPRVQVKTIFNVRDGRGVLASYWRLLNPHLPFESALKWYHHAINRWHPPEGAFYVRYEDVIQYPAFTLRTIGDYVGLKYTKESLSHWNEGHHQISGNTHATDSNVIRHDERWKTELSKDQLKMFDKYCGGINARYGYH